MLVCRLPAMRRSTSFGLTLSTKRTSAEPVSMTSRTEQALASCYNKFWDLSFQQIFHTFFAFKAKLPSAPGIAGSFHILSFPPYSHPVSVQFQASYTAASWKVVSCEKESTFVSASVLFSLLIAELTSTPRIFQFFHSCHLIFLFLCCVSLSS